MRTLRLASWIAVAVAAFGLAIVFWLWFGERQTRQAELAYGGPFELVDTRGESFTHEDLAGKPYAIFFGFTHCPDVCPTTAAEMDAWMDALGDEAEDMRFVFVTVDPERDTPELLGRYLDSFDERIIGLTGTPEAVDTMLSHYKIFARKVPLEGGEYTMDHTASVILIDSRGDFFATISYGENSETALAKLRRLVEQG